MKWRPTCCKMTFDKLENGAQCCFIKFECVLFISKFFVKAACIFTWGFSNGSFNPLTIYKRLQRKFCWHLCGALYRCCHFEKNILNRFKTCYGWESMACSLHCDLYTWSSCWIYSNYTYIVLFLAFVRYQQNHHQKVFNSRETTFVQGDWHSKIWQKIHWCIVFYISILGDL